MNTEAITRTAGPELDSLVATEVMGWRWLAIANKDGCVLISPETASQVDPDKQCRLCKTPLYRILGRGSSPYSTSIDAAWRVVEKMAERGWACDIKNYANNPEMEGRYGCYFYTDSARFYTSAETAPLAICLAALRAVGVEA